MKLTPSELFGQLNTWIFGPATEPLAEPPVATLPMPVIAAPDPVILRFPDGARAIYKPCKLDELLAALEDSRHAEGQIDFIAAWYNVMHRPFPNVSEVLRIPSRDGAIFELKRLV